MKITTQEEYALRCALQLARHAGGGPTTVSEIGRHEGLSGIYVTKLLSRLKRAGLARSVRGVNGGYILSREPSAVSIGEVLTAVSGPLFDHANCVTKWKGSGHECSHNSDCGIRPMWRRLMSQVNLVLNGTTLSDVLADERAVERSLSARLIPLTLSPKPAAAPVGAPPNA